MANAKKNKKETWMKCPKCGVIHGTKPKGSRNKPCDKHGGIDWSELAELFR